MVAEENKRPLTLVREKLKTKPRGEEKEPKQKPTAPKELGQRQMPSKNINKKKVDKKTKKNGREKCGQKYEQKTVDKRGRHRRV